MTEHRQETSSTRGLRIGRFVFAPHWIPALVTLVVAALLFRLGLWQLDRAHYKEHAQERIQLRAHESPHDLHSLLRQGDDLNDFPVRLRGYFLNDFNFLLDNRTHNQVPGYEVITPFVTDDRVVLINRGWIAQGLTRTQFPSIPATPGEITIEGLSQVPNPDFFVLKEDDYSAVTWPFVIQKIALEKSAALFDYPMAPFILRLNPDDHSGFVREWHSQNMGPEKHYGYAVQWFGLFTALWVIFFVVNTKRIAPENKK